MDTVSKLCWFCVYINVVKYLKVFQVLLEGTSWIWHKSSSHTSIQSQYSSSYHRIWDLYHSMDCFLSYLLISASRWISLPKPSDHCRSHRSVWEFLLLWLIAGRFWKFWCSPMITVPLVVLMQILYCICKDPHHLFWALVYSSLLEITNQPTNMGLVSFKYTVFIISEY